MERGRIVPDGIRVEDGMLDIGMRESKLFGVYLGSAEKELEGVLWILRIREGDMYLGSYQRMLIDGEAGDMLEAQNGARRRDACRRRRTTVGGHVTDEVDSCLPYTFPTCRPSLELAPCQRLSPDRHH